jgi:hypothetical protein
MHFNKFGNLLFRSNIIGIYGDLKYERNAAAYDADGNESHVTPIYLLIFCINLVNA